MDTSNISMLTVSYSENAKENKLPLDLQVKFQRLEKSINRILDNTDLNIRVSSTEYKKLKQKTRVKGLVFPAFNKTDQPVGPIAEDKLFDIVSSYYLTHTTFHRLRYNAYPLIPRLKNSPRYHEFERFDEPVSDTEEYKNHLDSYILRVTSFIYDGSRESEDQVFQYLLDVLDKNSEVITQKGCNILLEYCTSRFKFDEVKAVCFIMKHRGFTFPMKTYSTNRFMYFWNLLLPYIQPDYFTLNVVASGFKSKDSFYRALRWIDKHNIPFLSYSAIERFIPGFYHISYNRLSRINLKEEDRSILANLILAKRINWSMSKVNSFSEYNAYARRTNLEPTERTFHIIFDSIINDFSNFTFGIAFWNYFIKRNEATNAAKNINERDVYGSLLKALINIGGTVPSSESSNWGSLFGMSDVEDSLIKKLEFIALKRKIFNFNIKDAPTLQNVQTIEVQLQNLDWSGEPIWTFADNSLLFQRACYFFGYPYGIIDRRVATIMEKESRIVALSDATQLVQSIPSEKDRFLIQEAIDDHKLDMSMFDTWLQNYFRSKEQNADSLEK
ncbi:hypothetical protein HII12_002288 [Brettanomyces bruxellensis]|uniref:Uncharacterized protein n=1 Tax=Dekkera bruxellensis TaxID=5007 RepID=A0A8H6BJ82_DEKBR|nr:hypothetical protein HII12_002288 [Brettanomyces bruxellensis]